MNGREVAAINLLANAKRKGIDISLKEDQLLLSVADRSLVPADLLDEIKLSKEAIIAFLKTRYAASQGKDRYMIEKDTVSNIPLSYAQERLWVIDRMYGSAGYHIPIVLRVKGAFDADSAGHAIHEIMQRHAVLRTILKEQNGTLYQEVKEVNDFASVLRTEEFYGEEHDLKNYIKALIAVPFDLSCDPMLRVRLLNCENREFVLVAVIHHIASDGWSAALMLREFVELYQSRLQQRPAGLPKPEFQYADYAKWERNFLSEDALSKRLAYWEERLENIEPLELPTDFSRPGVLSGGGQTFKFFIEEDVAEALQQIAKQERVTLFMVLFAIFKVLLYRYTGQEDICVGMPVATRSQKATENLIGLFVNTLIIRSDLSNNPGVRQLLQQLRSRMFEAFEHHDAPFEKVSERIINKHQQNRGPLFQVMFSSQPPIAQGYFQLGDATATLEEFRGDTSKFELTFDVMEASGGIELRIEYATDLFTADTIHRMAQHYRTLLKSAIDNPDTGIASLNMLTEKEKEQLLSMSGDEIKDFPADKTIIDLFEDQVCRTPGNVALVIGDRSWTYKEVNELTTCFGNYLRCVFNVLPDDLIGIKIAHSEWIVFAILGILKSGAAYVPIDPEYPQSRIDYIIEDSQCKLVVDDNMLVSFEIEKSRYATDALIKINKPGDLAYVIYTSGTSGNPKGALVEHKQVVRLFKTDRFQFDFHSGDVWTMFHSYCFDFSVWEMYGALFTGAKLVLVPRMVAKDPQAFWQLLKREKVTILNQTPSAFYQLMKLANADEDMSVRYVIFGGEALTAGLLKEWKEKFPLTKLINMYGITETTVHVTFKEIKENEIKENINSIGTAIPTVSCYVLDTERRLLPVGISGELYVGGEGVCRGYLNREELTKQRFISNPFITGDRLYRTGDKVRWLNNGEMQYLGRLDDQVKIRAHRIELGEIEAALLKHNDIESALALVTTINDEKEIVAYIVSKKTLNAAIVRAHLEHILPAYMVPGYYVQINHIPVTQNGKVDKRNLPYPAIAGMALGTEYAPPENEIEAQLVVIWQKVLAVEKISINDNFFELGGNSIKLINLIDTINQAFKENIPVVNGFKHPNIKSFAAYMRMRNDVVDNIPLDSIAEYTHKPVDMMKKTINLLNRGKNGQ